MENIVNIIKELENTSSTNGKLDILKRESENELFRKVLYYTYNDNKYGVTRAKIKPNKNIRQLVEDNFFDFFSCLDVLAESNINDELREKVNDVVGSVNDDIAEIYIRILTKDLKCGIKKETIIKAMPELLYKLPVQQAYAIKDSNKPKDGDWFALSQKLNGTKGVYKNNILLSRQNKEYNGLNTILNELNQLQSLFLVPMVFDGELIRKNPKFETPDNENFRLTASILAEDSLGRKDEIEFVLYERLPLDEYEAGKSKLKYKQRREQLN